MLFALEFVGNGIGKHPARVGTHGILQVAFVFGIVDDYGMMADNSLVDKIFVFVSVRIGWIFRFGF
jgi:hypothetical protein